MNSLICIVFPPGFCCSLFCQLSLCIISRGSPDKGRGLFLLAVTGHTVSGIITAHLHMRETSTAAAAWFISRRTYRHIFIGQFALVYSRQLWFWHNLFICHPGLKEMRPPDNVSDIVTHIHTPESVEMQYNYNLLTVCHWAAPPGPMLCSKVL